MLTKTQTVKSLPVLWGTDQRLKPAMRACAAWAAIEEHDKILDVDCGDGALLANLGNKYRLTLCGMCDTPEQARAVRERLGDADVIFAHVCDIPWRDDTFDVALLSGALRGDIRRGLEEILRVLRAGGQFVMNVPLFRPRGDGELGRREIMRLMQEAGFREVSFRTAGLSGAIVGWKQGRLPD